MVARFGTRLATLVVTSAIAGSLDSQESGRLKTQVKTNTRSAFLGSHRIPDMDFVLHLILMDLRKPAQDQGILTTFCDDRHLPSSSSKGDESTSSALELNNHASAGFRFLRHVSKRTRDQGNRHILDGAGWNRTCCCNRFRDTLPLVPARDLICSRNNQLK